MEQRAGGVLPRLTATRGLNTELQHLLSYGPNVTGGRSLGRTGAFNQFERIVRVADYCDHHRISTREGVERLADARLYLLVTQELCATSAERVIDEALANGADVIQLREKSLDSRVFLDYARQVRKVTLAAEALLIINDRPLRRSVLALVQSLGRSPEA